MTKENSGTAHSLSNTYKHHTQQQMIIPLSFLLFIFFFFFLLTIKITRPSECRIMTFNKKQRVMTTETFSQAGFTIFYEFLTVQNVIRLGIPVYIELSYPGKNFNYQPCKFGAQFHKNGIYWSIFLRLKTHPVTCKPSLNVKETTLRSQSFVTSLQNFFIRAR